MKLGTISVTPKEVNAEARVPLTVKYVATSDLAETGTSYGRIQVTLPPDIGARRPSIGNAIEATRVLRM